MMKRIPSFLAAMTLCVAIFAAEKAQVVLSINPGMSCQNCENKIKNNLRFEKGVKLIETSIADQTVTVSYDPKKTDVDKIKQALAKIGYEASESPAKCNDAAAGCNVKGKCCGNQGGKCNGKEKKATDENCCKKK